MPRGLWDIDLARAPSPRGGVRPTWLQAHARQYRIPFKITLKKKNQPPKMYRFYVFFL